MAKKKPKIQGIAGEFSVEVADEENTKTMVKVVCGASATKFDVAGQTIVAVRDFLSDALNIGSEALALVNGKKRKEDYKLQGGDTLEFVKEAGEKGLAC